MEHKNDTQFNAKLWGKQKFGFRKLSIGLAAVALGITFLMSNGQLVRADETNSNKGASAQTEQTNSSSQKDTQATNAGAEAANKAADSLAKADDPTNKQTDSANSGATTGSSSTQKSSSSANTVAGNNASTKDNDATGRTGNDKTASAANTTKNGNTAAGENKDANSKGSADNNVAGSTKTVSGANSQGNSDSSAKAEAKTAAQLKNASAANNTDKNSTTLNVKGLLNGNSKLSAKELSEEKAVPSGYSDSVTVSGNSSTMTSNQDTAAVNVNINIPSSVTQITEDHPITVQVINGNTNNTQYLKTNESITGKKGWHFDYAGNNTFKVWFKDPTDPDLQPKSPITFSINVQGSNTQADGPKTVPVKVKFTYPDNETDIKDAFTTTYVSGKDKIQKSRNS